MTRERIANMIAYIIAIYPSFTTPSAQELELWYEALEKVEEHQASRAIKKHYRESRFPPHLSDILKAVKDIKRAELPTPAEAWQITLQATKGYDVDMPDAVKATVLKYGGIDHLKKSEAKMDYIRAEFLRTYGEVVDEYTETDKVLLPPPKEVKDPTEEILKQLHAELEERLKHE